MPSTAPTMALLLSSPPPPLLSRLPLSLPLPEFLEDGGESKDLCGGDGDSKEGGERDDPGGEGDCEDPLGDGGLGLFDVGGEGEGTFLVDQF